MRELIICVYLLNLEIRFEGGQNPLYRRLPKLKGVAGGNKKATKKYTVINIEDLNVFEPNAEVTIDSIQEVGILKSLSKAEKSLPLKVLGNGDITVPLTIKVTCTSLYKSVYMVDSILFALAY